MSQKLYCPMCHAPLVKGDVENLIDEMFECKGTLVFDLRKLKEVDPERIKRIKCYNCKRQFRYYVEK